MAAILCRVFCVEPCKAFGKCWEGCFKYLGTCCEGCCKCCGDICESFSKCCGKICQSCESCCDYFSGFCDKPFSGCLFTSIFINAVALIYGIIAIVMGGSQCDKPLLILAVILLVCALINAAFSIHVYKTMNADADNPMSNNDLSPSAKLYAFFKYDPGMACYIIFVIALIILLSVSLSMAANCSSNISNGVTAVSIILFIYLAVSMLILFSYVAFDAFKEWSSWCWCWLVPVCWPCLMIGCCLNVSDNFDKSHHSNRNKSDSQKTTTYKSNAEYQAPIQQNQPVIVVQQQPQPQPVQVAQVQYIQQPIVQQQQYQQPQYNPNANMNVHASQPGVFVVHGQQPQPQQQQQQNVEQEAVDDNDGIDYDEIKQKSKAAAKVAGKQAKKAGVAALGWMAKKMNDLNDKVQDNNDGTQKEGKEGK